MKKHVFLLLLCMTEMILLAAAGIQQWQKMQLVIWCTGFIALDLVIYICWIYKPYERYRQELRAFNASELEEICKLNYGLCPEQQELLEMANEIIATYKKLELEVHESELLALQNQINPHFLYNTLEAIRSDAIIDGCEEIASVVERLSRYFRYTISSLDKLVPLEEELHNVRDYFLIQQYRFGDNIELDISFTDDDERNEHLYVPKMVLQPLVENAIIHGLEPCNRQGHIDIRVGLTEDEMLIHVEDNGIGMEQDKLNDMNRQFRMNVYKKQKKGGIAMANVNNRVKLLFGDAYGLYMLSAPNQGTETLLRMPICLEGDNAR